MVINQQLAYHNFENIELFRILDKYVFTIKPKIYYAILMCKLKKTQFIPFNNEIYDSIQIHKENKKKKLEFEWLYEKIIKFYNWSSKEAKINEEYYYKLFEDRDKLLYFFKYFGVDRYYYKKYKFEIENFNPNKKKNNNKWF